MSRKTKEEKIQASARHAFYIYEANPQTSQKTVTKALNNNLIHDLRKTAILTGLIISAQIILFMLLRNKVIVLPGISY